CLHHVPLDSSLPCCGASGRRLLLPSPSPYRTTRGQRHVLVSSEHSIASLAGPNPLFDHHAIHRETPQGTPPFLPEGIATETDIPRLFHAILLPFPMCSAIIELRHGSMEIEQAMYRVEVDWAPAYELLVSLKA